MRIKGLRFGLRFMAFSVFVLAMSLPAQIVCPVHPAAGSPDPGEAATVAIYKQAILDAPTCVTSKDAGCAARVVELQSLLANAKQLQAKQLDCSVNGQQPAGTPLNAENQSYYATRAALWGALAADLTQHATDGTHQIPIAVQDGFLGVVVPALAATPIPAVQPIIVGPLTDQTKRFRVSGQPADANYPTSNLYVCVWPTQPATGASLDCTGAGSAVKPTAVAKGAVDAKGLTYVVADQSGTTDLTLNSQLTASQTVSIVQVSGASTAVSATSYGVGLAQQCNHNPFKNPYYHDCDMNFSIIGGVEQAGLSSQPSETDGFLRIFTRAGRKDAFAWGEIRLLSAPQQSSAGGVIAAFTDPSGGTITTAVSNVGTSIDFTVGGEYLPRFEKGWEYTISALAGAGGTTPLSSNSVTQAFTAPALGTVECNVLYTKFQKYFTESQFNIAKNDPTKDLGTTAGACLLNMNSPTVVSGSPTKYAPINTIGFSNQDRSNFFGKWMVGLRTIDRFKAPGAIACGDLDTVNNIAPCQRGIVDFTVGQDGSITGGILHDWVFKVDAVHPLPIKGTAFLYLFGSFSMRTAKNVNNDPLILQAASLTTVTGTGSTAVPNINTVVLPLQQPSRDFYRFGVGVDALCIFNKIFTSGSNCLAAAAPTPPNPPGK